VCWWSWRWQIDRWHMMRRIHFQNITVAIIFFG
jgi:hypothetical protein